MPNPVTAFSRLLFAFILASASFSGSLAAGFNDADVMHVAYPSWFKDSHFYDLQEDLNQATAKGKLGLMVLFTTQGCSYCDIFIKKSLGDARLAARVQKHFESVGLEIFDDVGMTDPRGMQMPIKQFAKREGAGFSPTLIFYGKDGTRILKSVGYQSPERFSLLLDYLIDGHYRSRSLADYVKGITAKAAAGDAGLTSDPLFSPAPYVLNRPGKKNQRPLVVLFEQPGCDECRNFHKDVLALTPIRDTLKKFNVVRLNAGDNKTSVVAPDGQRTTAAAWFEKTGFARLPALLFFNEQGKQVLETDALVLHNRMTNSMNFVLERAYEKGWTYQRFARSKAIARSLKKQQSK